MFHNRLSKTKSRLIIYPELSCLQVKSSINLLPPPDRRLKKNPPLSLSRGGYLLEPTTPSSLTPSLLNHCCCSNHAFHGPSQKPSSCLCVPTFHLSNLYAVARVAFLTCRSDLIIPWLKILQ